MADTITTWTPISAPTDFRDDAVFDIDSKTKSIQVLIEQPIVAGENKSQFIKFQMGRYYDAIDLTEMQVNIVFLSPAGNRGISAAVNTEYSDDAIRFGWLVPYAACPEKGKLYFAVEFVGADYTLKTTAGCTNVLDSISDRDIVPEPVEQEWYIVLQANVATLMQEAQRALGRVEGIFNALGTPMAAGTAAEMVEESAIYVYTGSEPNYEYGYWYYHDGTEWHPGGEYASTALIVDDTLSVAGRAADAKAVGDKISDSVDSIQSEVGYFTEYRPVLMSKGRINIGSSTTNLTPEDVDGYEYAIVACSQGDMFTINAQTESGIRVWGFVAADGTNVYKTNGSNAIESIIIAPAGSEYLVINNTVKGNISYIGQRTSKHVDAMEKEVNYPIKMSQQTNANGEYYYINAEASTISFNGRYTIATPCRYAIVPCVEGDVFTINATGGLYPRAYAFASVDGTNLQKADKNATLTDYEVTAPANSAFLIINDFSDRTSYKGTLANCPVKRNQLDGVQADVSGALLDVSEIKTDLYNTPIAMIGTNQYINLGFTDLTQPVNLTRLYGMEGCKYAIVECQEGDKFILNAAGGSYPRAYAFIDSDNLILERAEQNASFSNAVITAPANTAKLVINDKSGATSYYGKKSLTYRVDTLESAGATPLKLNGKTMINFGDSIFGRGQGASGISGRLAYKTGATVYNCGLSGTAMAIRQSLPYYNPFAMCNLADAIASGNFSTQEAALSESDIPAQAPQVTALLENLDFSTIDYVTIALGTNDWGGTGAVIDNTENKYDTTAVCGALRHSIETILNAYPKAIIIILSTIYRAKITEGAYTDQGANGRGYTLQDLNTALRGVADEYHLKFIDNFNVGFNKWTCPQYYASNDGTHPDIAGFEVLAENISAHI